MSARSDTNDRRDARRDRAPEAEAKRTLRALARQAPAVVGSQVAFILVLVATIVWVAIGPFVGFSDAWLLVPSAVASIVALILVVLLQYSQNRDTRALQLKLDELIRSLGDARMHLLRVERMSDDELTALENEFERMRESEP
jgi:low affinity Fe/Cu permease